MFQSVVGIGFALYGLYAVYYSNMNPAFDSTPMWWLKVAGFIVGGIVVGGWSLVPKIKELVLQYVKKQPTKELVMAQNASIKADGSVTIAIKSEEEKDIEAIYYLTERLKTINGGEAYELCRKLNDVLFVLHHPAKEEKV